MTAAVVRGLTHRATRAAVALGDRLLGQEMVRRLSFLEEAQWWPPERIAEHRHSLLRELIVTSYDEVPFYRRLLDEHGIDPGDISNPDDLARLPIVTKDMLRRGYPDAITRPTGHKAFEECTSGSTGRPFCVRKDGRLTGWYRASFLLALSWAGWRMGDPHLQFGITPQRRRGRWLKDRLLRCRYVSGYDLTDETLDNHLRAIDRESLRFVFGYPVAVYLLAKRATQLGWDSGTLRAVTWGDTLFDEHRRAIEEVFQTKVLDTYGCGEGFQVAAQCGASDLYHLHDLDVIVEYVDDEGRPTSSGPGNLLITRLFAGPMPFIRYRVGDVGVPSGERCPCGRGFGTMSSILGREADVILTPSGNRLIVHFFTGILEHFPQIDTFQVVQYEPDSVVLRILPADGFSSEVGKEIVRKLKAAGADLQIDVEVVDEIPLSKAGKRRFVLSELHGTPTK